MQSTLKSGGTQRSMAIKIAARGPLMQSDVSVDSGVASTPSARGRVSASASAFGRAARRGGDEEGSEAGSDLAPPSEQGSADVAHRSRSKGRDRGEKKKREQFL